MLFMYLLKVGGQCPCKRNAAGQKCDSCKPGFFSLSEDNPDGCSPCDCDPVGVRAGDITCDPTTGQCNCKSNVRGNLQYS